MKFFWYILYTCAWCFVPGSTSGQVVIEALPRWMFSSHFNLTFPQPPANQFMTNTQAGYQLEMQYRLQYNKPFVAGVYFNESTLSKYVLKYSQSSGAGVINIKEKANTRRLEGGFTIGFYPEVNWLIQPYLQSRASMALFQTSSILTDRDSQENIERISEYSTVVPAYGLDLGFHIVPNIWYIRADVRIGYVANTSTTYFLLNEEEAGTTGFPIEYFDSHVSSGRWLKISAGLSYLF